MAIALSPFIVDLPLATGEQQSVDPRIARNGTIGSIINYRFTKRGRLGKRNGFEAINLTDYRLGAAITSSPILCGEYDSKPFFFTQDSRIFLPFPDATGPGIWDMGGGNAAKAHTSCHAEPPVQFGVSTGGGAFSTGPQCAATNGYLCFVWVEALQSTLEGTDGTGALTAAILDQTNKNIIIRKVLVSSGVSAPNVLAVGNHFVIVWGNGTGAMVAATCDTTSLTFASAFSGTTVLKTNVQPVQASRRVVAAAYSTTHFYTAYWTNAGAGTDIIVDRWDKTALGAPTHTSTIVLAAGPSKGLAVGAWSDLGVVVAWGDTPGVTRYAILAAADLSVVVAATTIDATASTSARFIIDRLSATQALVAYSVSEVSVGTPSLLADVFYLQRCDTAGAVATLATLYHTTPASKFFTVGSRRYLALATGEALRFEDIIAICQTSSSETGGADSPKPECWLTGPGEGENILTAAASLRAPASVAVVGDTAIVPFLFRASEGVQPSNSVTHEVSMVRGASIRFDHTQRHQAAKDIGGCALISGGITALMDGSEYTEVGFCHGPGTAVSDAVAGGSLTASSSYGWVVVWEYWIGGRRVLSSPSAAGVQALGVGQGTIRVRSKLPYVTRKTQGRIRALLYRTASNGSVYYLSRALPADTAVDTGTVLFTDIQADTDITSRETLYSISEPASSHVGSSKCVAIGGGRAWYGVGQSVRFSKLLPDGLAPDGADAFVIPLFQDPSPVNGLAELDDHMVILKGDGVYAVPLNAGPADNGDGSFPEPRLVSRVGCDNPRSVVTTKSGIFYSSGNQIWLLPSGMGAPVWVGRDVEDSIASLPIVTSAIDVRSQNQARFTVTDSAGIGSRNGRILCFDYENSAWTEYRLDPDGKCLATASMWGAKYVAGNADTVAIYRQRTDHQDTFLGVNSHIDGEIITANFHVGLLAGFSRIWSTAIRGEQRGDCRLAVSAAMDGGSSFSGSRNFDITSSVSEELILQYENPVQRLSSVRYRLQETLPGGGAGTEGAIVNHLALYCGVVPGRRPVKASLRK